MVITEILKTIILGIIQGITEWLPISSTGHMILVEKFMVLNVTKEFKDTFFVVIQLGSILAVVVLYFKKLNPFGSNKTKAQVNETMSIWYKVIVGCIPAGIFGILFEKVIEDRLRGPVVIALALIIYGVIMIFIENKNKTPHINDFKELTYRKAFSIGCFQALSLIPGTSRSASTIIGGVILGTSRSIAAEYSFFLAIPIMVGASFLKLLKTGFQFISFEWLMLGIGSLVAFVVSLVVINFLMDYIKKHDFKVFGYYRIILGIIVMLYFNS
jgi:undecaprenyl-diphosphatase